MKSKKTFLIVALFSLIITAVCFTSVFAAEDQKHWQKNSKRADVAAALENNDYDAWLEAVGSDSPLAELITPDKFPRLVQAHDLMRQAMAIREELGIKDLRQGQRHDFYQSRQAIRQAIADNDYQAFLEAIPVDCPMAEKINPNTFSQLVQAHQYLTDDDLNSAKQIFDELGIKPFAPKPIKLKNRLNN